MTVSALGILLGACGIIFPGRVKAEMAYPSWDPSAFQLGIRGNTLPLAFPSLVLDARGESEKRVRVAGMGVRGTLSTRD